MADKKTVYELIPQLGKLRDEVLFGDVDHHLVRFGKLSYLD